MVFSGQIQSSGGIVRSSHRYVHHLVGCVDLFCSGLELGQQISHEQQQINRFHCMEHHASKFIIWVVRKYLILQLNLQQNPSIEPLDMRIEFTHIIATKTQFRNFEQPSLMV